MWRQLGSRCCSELGLDGGPPLSESLWATEALWLRVGRVGRTLSCSRCWSGRRSLGQSWASIPELPPLILFSIPQGLSPLG